VVGWRPLAFALLLLAALLAFGGCGWAVLAGLGGVGEGRGLVAGWCLLSLVVVGMGLVGLGGVGGWLGFKSG
jgi:hypothetical protein